MSLSLHTQQHRLRGRYSFHVRKTPKTTVPESDLVPDVLSAGLCLYADKGVGKSACQARILGYYQDRYDEAGTGQIAIANSYIRDLWHRPPIGTFPVCMAGHKRRSDHTVDCLAKYTLRRCDAYMWDWILEAAPVTCAMVGIDEAGDVWPIWGAMSNRMRDSTTQLRGLRHRQIDLICGTTHPERLGAMASEQIEFYGLVEAGERESRWAPPKTAVVTIYRFDGSALPRQYESARALASTEIELGADWWGDKTDPPYASWSKMSPHWYRVPVPAGAVVEPGWRVMDPVGAALDYEQWSPLEPFEEGFEVELNPGALSRRDG
ncbi:MAG: hypothetical protein F4213_08135 [Boseongicola sp. SB0677_bin_26]|nr:hypothetical protein [Boseongicola sp. SB0677_bin_26]